MTKLKRVIFLLAIILLQGCSSHNTVHVYAKYLSEEQEQQVVESLSVNENLTVEVNRLEFPSTVNDNTLIYAPSRGTDKAAIEVMEQVSSLGFPIGATGLMLANNHSFSANNMGIYLVPAGLSITNERARAGKYNIPLYSEYGARNCENTATLEIKESGNFVLNEEVWDKNKQDYQQNQYRGTWSIEDNQYLLFRSPAWQQVLYFHRQTFERDIENGKLQGYQLIPMTKYNKGSNYARVYCTYEISQVME
ncbi:hypothetical protein ACFSBU_14630 [Thalassotalea marina]|uniref:Lipoprotein n=2 Tax=Thalassotalea marina TaxID=1673741 RepID=A0A919BM96_9GAMM|nr:hypothetical protein GCM10017161_32320 [Thalassotalea marina]